MLVRHVPLGLDAGAYVVEPGRQVAVVIDGVYQCLADQCLTRVEVFQFQLPEQMIAQRFAALVRKLADRTAFAIPAAVLDSFQRVALPAFLGLDRFDFGGAVGTGGRRLREILHLEHDVLFQRFLNLCIQVEHGKLQQADGLLQLRRHRQGLTEFELQRRL